jgi:hypothetical protein
MARWERLVMAVLALVAAAALATRPALYALLLGEAANSLRIAWTMAGFFTLWAGLAAAILFGRAAITGRRPGDRALSALTLSLVVVGGVYHLALSGLWDLPGIHRWADAGLHTVLPLGGAVLWLARAGRMRPRRADPLQWLVWPAGYAAYALLRGALTGVYPYPFLDPQPEGWLAVAVTVGGIGLGAVALAWGMWGLSHALRR